MVAPTLLGQISLQSQPHCFLPPFWLGMGYLGKGRLLLPSFQLGAGEPDREDAPTRAPAQIYGREGSEKPQPSTLPWAGTRVHGLKLLPMALTAAAWSQPFLPQHMQRLCCGTRCSAPLPPESTAQAWMHPQWHRAMAGFCSVPSSNPERTEISFPLSGTRPSSSSTCPGWHEGQAGEHPKPNDTVGRGLGHLKTAKVPGSHERALGNTCAHPRPLVTFTVRPQKSKHHLHLPAARMERVSKDPVRARMGGCSLGIWTYLYLMWV